MTSEKRPGRLSRLLAKHYASPPIRGLMAAASSALSIAGDPVMSVASGAVNVFDAVLLAQVSRIESNRQRLSDRTEARLEVLDEAGKFDETVLDDPEYQSLAFQAAVASAGESQDEKIEWYAAILAGAASHDRPKDLNMRALLATLTSLTPEEMRLARQFYEGFSKAGAAARRDGVLPPPWGPDTDLYLQHLESAHLIVPRIVQGAPRHFQGPIGNYFVTDTFHRLMHLVRQTDPAT